MVYAEVSVGFRRIEDCDTALEDIGIVHEAIPKEALFLAGKAFLSYRHNGGTKTAILPDFIIGAHAAIRGYPLLTRDPSRVESAYPRLRIVSPLFLPICRIKEPDTAPNRSDDRNKKSSSPTERRG
jgi:predicted nucleic acid-binding protein